MNISRNNRRSATGNRYNFNQPNLESPESDWPTGAGNAEHYDSAPQFAGENDEPWHEPAPMKKREQTTRPASKSKRPKGKWSTNVLAILLGLASFAFVVDLAGVGRMQSLVQYLMVPTETVQLSTTNLDTELPEADLVAEAPVPAPQPEPLPITPKAEEPISALLPEPEIPPPEVAIATPAPEILPDPIPAVIPEKVEPAETIKPLEKAAPVIAQILQGELVRDCAECPELIAFMAGSINTKTDSDPNRSEGTVSIERSFAIARNTITFDDWQKCVNEGGCSPATNDAGWGRGTRPVIFISFDDVTDRKSVV